MKIIKATIEVVMVVENRTKQLSPEYFVFDKLKNHLAQAAYGIDVIGIPLAVGNLGIPDTHLVRWDRRVKVEEMF